MSWYRSLLAPLNTTVVGRLNVVYSSMLLSHQEGNKSEVQYVWFEMDDMFNFLILVHLFLVSVQ